MRTEIVPHLLQELDVKDAEAALRPCVHCGFCNATCPTYLPTGKELEGPRGRIYLMKTLLEGYIKLSQQTLGHIDNCLGCLSCETTCPSGIDYSYLLEEACPRSEKKVKRSPSDHLLCSVIACFLPYPAHFRLALKMVGPEARAILPRSLKYDSSARYGSQTPSTPS